jgi:putative endonuclease
MKPWYVYIVRCRDNSLYTGVTIDISRRLDEHNHDNRLGAKYTRSRRPVKLIYQCQFSSRAEACRFEYRIKAMTKQQKLGLAANQ